MVRLEPAVIADLLRQSMAEGRMPYVQIISDSMRPLLQCDDQVRLAPASIEQLLPGDIIVVLGLTQLVTHRYWGYLNNDGDVAIITRGDRPRDFDQPVPAVNLIGRVVARRRQQRLLPLTEGAGRWLNQLITRVAAVDIRISARPVEVPASATAYLPPTCGLLAGRQPNHPMVLFIRRLFFFSWVSLLTAVVNLTATITREPEYQADMS
jgi:hypothetical protein